jgi:hypothetical protein
MRKLSEYIAPSWSWACVVGTAAWYWSTLSDSRLISVLDARTDSSSSDSTGRLLSGLIKVKGLLMRAFSEGAVTRGKVCEIKLMSTPADGNYATTFGNDMQQLLPNLPSITATLSEDFEGQTLGYGREILLLPLLGRLVAEASKPMFVIERIDPRARFLFFRPFYPHRRFPRQRAGECGDVGSLHKSGRWSSLVE